MTLSQSALKFYATLDWDPHQSLGKIKPHPDEAARQQIQFSPRLTKLVFLRLCRTRLWRGMMNKCSGKTSDPDNRIYVSAGTKSIFGMKLFTLISWVCERQNNFGCIDLRWAKRKSNWLNLVCGFLGLCFQCVFTLASSELTTLNSPPKLPIETESRIPRVKAIQPSQLHAWVEEGSRDEPDWFHQRLSSLWPPDLKLVDKTCLDVSRWLRQCPKLPCSMWRKTSGYVMKWDESESRSRESWVFRMKLRYGRWNCFRNGQVPLLQKCTHSG